MKAAPLTYRLKSIAMPAAARLLAGLVVFAAAQPRRPPRGGGGGGNAAQSQAIGKLKPRACANPAPAALEPCGRDFYARVYADGSRVESVAAMLADAGVNESHRPTILVLGAGHSGTSTVTAEILKLGWTQWTATAGFERHFTQKHEDGFVVHANDMFIQKTRVDKVNVNAANATRACGDVAARHYALGRCVVSDHPQLKRRWALYPRPAVLKDPRFVWALHLWPEVFAGEAPPLVVHVRRDQASIRRSHEARGEVQFKNLGMDLADAVASRVHWGEWQRRRWCGPTISLNVASLMHAARANHFTAAKPGGGGGRKPGPRARGG